MNGQLLRQHSHHLVGDILNPTLHLKLVMLELPGTRWRGVRSMGNL